MAKRISLNWSMSPEFKERLLEKVAEYGAKSASSLAREMFEHCIKCPNFLIQKGLFPTEKIGMEKNIKEEMQEFLRE